MTKTPILLLFFLFTFILKGQELTVPILSQYTADNIFLMSPTYAGVGDHIKVRLNGLTQWVGIKDAPDTQTLAVDARLGNRSGIGMLLYNDSNGNTLQRGARVSFAHHLTLDRYDDEFLSFGLSYNFNQFRLAIENLTEQKGQVITNDRATTNHNFEVGILYRFSKFYLTVNASNLLPKDNNTQFDPINEPSALRNYYAHVGYSFMKNKNSTFEIEPSIFFHYFESDGRSETDLNAKFRFYNFENYYYVGLTYRFINDQIGIPLYVAPLAGFKKDNFFFGYSYQFDINETSSFNQGTHVLTVGIDLFQGISNCRCTY